jgi:hypothetical protein
LAERDDLTDEKRRALIELVHWEAAPKDQPMCTLLNNLLMHCGPTPIFEYTLIAGGVALLILDIAPPCVAASSTSRRGDRTHVPHQQSAAE